MAKALAKFTSEEIAKRTKTRVFFPEECQLTAIYGADITVDETGKKFADIPGGGEFEKVIRGLHPEWVVGDTFVDMGE